MNYAVTTDEHDELVLHRADCPDARTRAAHGEPVLTMLDCQREPPAELKRHSCLKTGENAL
jgi:hypothetical protein